MRRSVVLFVGLAIFATGIWLIATEHTRTATCNAQVGLFPGGSTPCQGVAWAYFGGFVATGLGVIVMLFTGLMRRHEMRYRRHAARTSDYAIRLGAPGATHVEHHEGLWPQHDVDARAERAVDRDTERTPGHRRRASP